MPSLSVIRSAPNEKNVEKCTFDHFYSRLIKDEPYLMLNNLRKAFIQCLMYAVLILLAVFCLDFILFTIIYFNSRKMYLHHQLYYGQVVMWIIMQSTLLIAFFFVSIQKNIPKSLMKVSILIAITLGTSMFIFGAIFIILCYNFHHYLETENINKSNEIDFQYLDMILDCAEYTYTWPYCSIYFFYTNCVYQPIAVVFVALFHQVYFRWRLRNYNMNCNSTQLSAISRNNTKHINDMQMPLVSFGDTDTDSGAGADDCELEWELYEKAIKNTQYLLIGFGIIWFLFLCMLYLLLSKYVAVDGDLERYFFGLLISTSLFKFLTKIIARRIDVLSITYCGHIYSNYTAGAHHIASFVSVEMVMEVIFSVLYYTYYYCYFVIELSSINKFDTFIVITIYHVLSEVCQSILRFSSYYFDKTAQIYKICDKFLNDHKMNKTRRIYLKMFRDDSTFIEWQTRHSIDMSLRMVALVSSFVFTLIYLTVIGKKTLGINSYNSFYYALFYFSASFIVDMIYFLCVFLINNFNVWRPFLTMFSAKDHKVVACLLFVGCGYIANSNYYFHSSNEDKSQFSGVSWF